MELQEVMNRVVGTRTKMLLSSSRERLLIQAGFGGGNAYRDLHALIMGNFMLEVQRELPIANPGSYDVLLALFAAVQTTRRNLTSMANHQGISKKDRRQGKWAFVDSLDETVGATDDNRGMTRIELVANTVLWLDTPELHAWREVFHFLTDIQFRIIMVSWGLVSIDVPQVSEILRSAKQYGASSGLRADWATNRVLSALFDLPSTTIRYHYESAERAILSRPGCLAQTHLQLTGLDVTGAEPAS